LRSRAADFWDCLAPKSFARHNVFRKENLGCRWLSLLLQMQNGDHAEGTKGLNRFQNYFSCRPFEILLGNFSCIPAVQFRLITVGDKVPLESVR